MSEALGKIITFYSYKGGTGRSMVLANVAWTLAASGFRVLAIDWDLEAPGLHRYFHPFLLDSRLLSSPGVIDWIVAFATAALTRGPVPEGHDSGATAPDGEWFRPYADLTKYAVSLNFDFPKPGTLDFIPAGKQDPGYAIRVNSFNWKDLYEKLGGGVFLEAAKNTIRKEYDYVLIDSRTGVSDTSGICTIQMPDELVVCFTLNSQSMNGAANAARSAREQRVTPAGQNSIKLWAVPMRIETSEKERRDRGMEKVCNKFNVLLDHLSPEEQDEYWGRVQVPYLPFYAFEEVLATLADKLRQSNTLLSSVEYITGCISGGTVNTLKVLDEQKRRSAAALFARHSAEEDLDDLLRLAKEYELIREKMPPGAGRTYLMTALVERVRALLQDSDPGDLPKFLFDMNKPGTRIVAIATAQLSLNPSNVDMAIQAIAEPVSAFEQYHALALADQLLATLDSETKSRLAAAIHSQQGKYIIPENSDRWAMSQAIMGHISSIPPSPHDPATSNLPQEITVAGFGAKSNTPESATGIPQSAGSGVSGQTIIINRNLLKMVLSGAVIVIVLVAVAFYLLSKKSSQQPVQPSGVTAAPAAPVTKEKPPVPTPGQAEPAPQQGWGVIVSADNSLEANPPGSPSAAWEVLLAWRVGYRNISLFHRGNFYWTIIEEPDEPSANAALNKVKTGYPQYGHWKDATKVNLLTWCPKAIKTQGVEIGGASANVYDCGGS
jgi:MinD-like ATPase involved in chromosome partitioning or flagellar assembly